jgi:hypothetical protein
MVCVRAFLSLLLNHSSLKNKRSEEFPQNFQNLLQSFPKKWQKAVKHSNLGPFFGEKAATFAN